MSDVSTYSQVEFEILLDEIERMATADDVISDGEWADADAGPPPAVAAVATTGAPTDHGYAEPTPGTVHTVVAELHAPPGPSAGAVPTASPTTGGNAGGSNTAPPNAAFTSGAATSTTVPSAGRSSEHHRPRSRSSARPVSYTHLTLPTIYSV